MQAAPSWTPLGPLCASFGVPGLLLFDAPVYARSSYGSLWGAREVRRVVPACFLIDFEQFGGGIPSNLDLHKIEVSGVPGHLTGMFQYVFLLSATCCFCTHLRQRSAWELLPNQGARKHLRSLECPSMAPLNREVFMKAPRRPGPQD